MIDHERSNSIRSISRALEVLVAMNRRPMSSLHELHQDTALPKATLHRILETLRGEGFITAAQRHGNYVLTGRVRALSEGFGDREELVAIAIPHLMRVTREMKWPLDIATPDGGEVVVRYSTVPYSPLAVQHAGHGERLALHSTAAGLAYLAWCHETVRDALLPLALEVPEYGTGQRLSDQELFTRMDATRTRGYGLRVARHRGESATIAVPVPGPDGAVASLSLTSFGSLLDESFQRRLQPLLVETAAQIAQEVAALPRSQAGTGH